MLEDLKSVLGQIPGMEGRIKSLENKKPLNDYIECENCGNLVRKERAQVFSCLDSEYTKKDYTDRFYGVYSLLLTYQSPKAQEIFLCNHCDIKKFKKDNNIKLC